MNVVKNPLKRDWKKLVERPVFDAEELFPTVQQVFKEIKTEGNAALRRYTAKFDGVTLERFELTEDERKKAVNSLSDELKEAIEVAYHNLYAFHVAQKEAKKVVTTTEGVECWRESRAIEKVGFYIPGGSAPLFSTVLMLGIPAKIAGCQEVILCTPPNKEGQIHPAISYAAQRVGVKAIYKLGGIQAIGAMTYGTEEVPKVYKLFGPGNQYVMAAKQMAQNFGVAIDMPAGPSEVLVVADKTAVPQFVAADLLSQAEHGPDSQVLLVSDSEALANEVNQEVKKQLASLPRKAIASKALENSKLIVLESIDECLEFSNIYAPEHLVLALENASEYTNAVQNAGSVFLGNYSCESLGDYASGTNHTLPTNAYARAYSGVSVDSFVKKITFQSVSEQGILNIGKAVEQMAAAEELEAHKRAVSFRLAYLTNKS